MPNDMDAMLARLEVRLDNLEAHVMREFKEVKDTQKSQGERLVYFDKLTAIGRAFTAVAMAVAGLIGWALSQFPIIKGP